MGVYPGDGENVRGRRVKYKSRQRSLEMERAMEKEKGKSINRLEGENSRLFKTKWRKVWGPHRKIWNKPVLLPPRPFRSASERLCTQGTWLHTVSACTVKQKFLHTS